MSSLIRPRVFAVAALLAVLGGAWQYLGSANADDRTTTADSDTVATSTSSKKKHSQPRARVPTTSSSAQGSASRTTRSSS